MKGHLKNEVLPYCKRYESILCVLGEHFAHLAVNFLTAEDAKSNFILFTV